MGFHRALLWLYPASFRREYGAELEAVFAARRRDADGVLGIVTLWIDTVLDVIRTAGLIHWDILRQDLRYIARSLARAPGFALTAVLVTALGVGANAAAFSVADYVLIKPLPFPDPDRLVSVWQHPPGYSQMELSPGNYRDWKTMSSSFSAMGAHFGFATNLVGTEEPERVEGTVLTPEVFAILGARPLLGRAFTEADADPDGAATVVLSHGFWRSQLAADPDAVGRVINLDGTPTQIVGVMPAQFRFPTSRSRLWVPLRLREEDYLDRSNNSLEVVARLEPGVSIEQARADLDVIARRLAQLYPSANRDTGATVDLLRDNLSERSRLLVIALAGASLCILLIACANLGSLLLARGLARQRELAVRTALGAGRDRLVRQLITEALVVAGLGGLLGIAVALAAVPLLARLVPDTLPLAGGPAIDLRVLGFAGAVTLVTCLLFAVLPARRASFGVDLEALRQGSRGGGGRKERLRAVLVTVEVAASVVLLIGAGLLMRAIQRVQEVDPGFRTGGLITLRTSLSGDRYRSHSDRNRFYTTVLAQVTALPGVSGAAYVSAVPLVWGGGIWPVLVRGEPEVRAANNTASIRFVTPGYFETLGIPLRGGRDVGTEDRSGVASVAVVSESFAARYWPGEDPLGKVFRTAFADRRVVGVVADIKLRGLERESEPQVYFPAAQANDSVMRGYWPQDLVIRSAQPLASLMPAVRGIIRTTDPEQPVSDVRTMETILAEQTASRAVQLQVLGALAGVALVLAAIGIHGLLSMMVSQRAREIGVRMALGAQRPAVVRLVLGRGLLLAVAGIVPGVAAAYLAARAMRAVLFGVPPSDLVTFSLVVGLSLVMAVAGCLAPAIRAVRTEPVRVLAKE
jgi:putative ABC transport system permease protein